jgi:hypothetical protein
MAALLDDAENPAGPLHTGDEAEDATVERLRPLGRSALDQWAKQRHTDVLIGFACVIISPPRPTQPTSKAFVAPQRASDHLSVRATLRLCEEPTDVPDNHAPVRTALRYLGNRTDQLDYARALALDLPSAPASSESGHSLALHARIKKAGTSWTEAKLHGLSQLRSLRALRANLHAEHSWDRERPHHPLHAVGRSTRREPRPYHHNNYAHRPPQPGNGEFTRLARNLRGTSSSYACSTARGGSGRVLTPMHFTAPAPEVTGARRPRNRAMSATSSLSRRMPTVNILGFDLLKFACPTLALVRKKQRPCSDDAGNEPLFFHRPCFSSPLPPFAVTGV